MKQIKYNLLISIMTILFLGLMGTACGSGSDSSNSNNGAQVNKGEKAKTEEVEAVKPKKRNKLLKVKTPDAYSAAFIDRLHEGGDQEIELEGDKMRVSGTEHVFPTIPEMGKTFKLRGSMDDVALNMRIDRINQSSIAYSYTAGLKGKQVYELKGEAHLHPNFYLGSESDTDEKGNSYMVEEYYAEDDKCMVYFRLGLSEQGKLQAKAYRQCHDEGTDLATLPVLREQ